MRSQDVCFVYIGGIVYNHCFMMKEVSENPDLDFLNWETQKNMEGEPPYFFGGIFLPDGYPRIRIRSPGNYGDHNM